MVTKEKETETLQKEIKHLKENLDTLNKRIQDSREERNSELLKDVKEKILETLREEKLNEDPALYYQTLVDIREDKKIEFKDDEIKKQYNKLMDQLIDSAKEQNQ